MGIEDFFALPKYHRRSFVGLVVVTCLLLIGASFASRFFLGGDIGEFTFLVTTHILSGVIASAIILFFVFMFVPKGQRLDQLVEIPSEQITKEFMNLILDAKRWFYSGNFGRHLRSRVLRDLAGRTAVGVQAFILDPRILSLCKQHAEYRNYIKTVDGKSDYTADDVALEAVVTIVVCAWYLRNRQMSIELFLSKTFDPVRMDASDDAMILTVGDRQRPALKVNRGHFMFDHFMLELKYLAEQSYRLAISGFPTTKSLQEITAADVALFLAEIGFADLCTRLGSERIANAIHLDRNPYEQ